MFIDKLEKLQHQLIENNLDAFVIIPGSNFRYLTGGDFHLMERPTALIISKNQILKFSICDICFSGINIIYH